jgi:hypothetical protein
MISLVQDEWVISVVFLHGFHFKNLHFCILWFVLDFTFANLTITIQVLYRWNILPLAFFGGWFWRSGVHNSFEIPFNPKPIPTCWKETSIVIVSFLMKIHGCAFVVTLNVIPSYQVSTLIYHICVPNSRFPYPKKVILLMSLLHSLKFSNIKAKMI